MLVRMPFVHSIQRRAPLGFGLIELMITIGIVAILAALAMPSFRQSIQSNRTTTEANDFVSAINIARGEAMTRSRPVTVCPSNAAATQCSASTDWTTHQWIAFTDYGAKGTVDGADQILRVWKPIDAQDTLVSDPAVQWISFDRAGNAVTDNAIANAGVPPDVAPGATFTLQPQACAPNAKVQRKILVQLQGRVSVDSGACT